MAIVDVLFRTMDDQGTPVPIFGVKVQVFDVSDFFIVEGTTDVLGEVSVPLLGDTPGVPYTVRFFKAGVTFSTEGKLSVTVTDPPSPPNTFEITGHIGMSGSLVWLRTISDDAIPVPIPSSRIRLYDSLDLFLSEFETDSSGESSVVLTGSPSPGTDYIVRVSKDGWTFENGPTQIIQVVDPLPIGATNEFDLIAHTTTIPESIDPYFCVVSGYLCLPSGSPVRSLRVRFIPRLQSPAAILSGGIGQATPAVIQRRVIVGEAYEVTTSDTGYLEVSLPRGGVFEVDVLGWMDSLWPCQGAIVVPNTAGAKLEDVLFPYLKSIVLGTTSPVVVHWGGYSETSISLFGSNDQEISGKELIEQFIDWEIADPSVAAVQITQEGLIRFDGLTAGSTTVTFSRVADTYVPRVPDVPTLIAPVITVEVTA